MCVYVCRTRFPSSRAIKDVYLEIYLFLYHVFMPLNLFHFASRRFFSAFSPFGVDDPYFPVPCSSFQALYLPAKKSIKTLGSGIFSVRENQKKFCYAWKEA